MAMPMQRTKQYAVDTAHQVPWHNRPDSCLLALTVHRRISEWMRNGTIDQVRATHAAGFEERGDRDA